MSGGHFDYQQFHIEQIADEVEHLIASNESNEVDEWGNRKGSHFSKATIGKFKEGLAELRLAYTYAQRIDWLVSGDDSEDSFHQRLDLELRKIPASGLRQAAEAALLALEGPASTLRARSPAEGRQWSDERMRVVRQLKAALEK